MESETDMEEGTETETAAGAGDVEEGKGSEPTAGETVKEGEETTGGEPGEAGGGAEVGETEVGGEHIEGEQAEGEHAEGEQVDGEKLGGEHLEGEAVEGEHVAGEQAEGEDKVEGEGVEGEKEQGADTDKPPEEQLLPPPDEVEEEEEYPPEPPPDPAAPYDFSDSKEALKAPFELRPDQLAEVEQLWEMFQNYTPAYSDIDGYITEKELIYMLKSLLVMTYTVEQLHELIAYCCRPPHPKGFIFFNQFVKMVTLRQRDFPIEEEIRSALQFFDPGKEGILDRENMREVLTKQGNKMAQKLVDNLIKEVDMSNDGTIGIEDIIGTMCIDLNEEDMQLLRNQVYPPKEVAATESETEF